MTRYSKERKEAVIRRMMPPENTPIPLLVEETGISDVTLYQWRKQARGLIVPGDGRNPENWSPEAKFAVVLETAAMNEAELSEYCRKKGLFVEQTAVWRANCLQGNALVEQLSWAARQDIQRVRNENKQLKRELHRKDKALAETAALLALRKKMHAIWGRTRTND